jgi:hypothetical protein
MDCSGVKGCGFKSAKPVGESTKVNWVLGTKSASSSPSLPTADGDGLKPCQLFGRGTGMVLLDWCESVGPIVGGKKATLSDDANGDEGKELVAELDIHPQPAELVLSGEGVRFGRPKGEFGFTYADGGDLIESAAPLFRWRVGCGDEAGEGAGLPFGEE